VSISRPLGARVLVDDIVTTLSVEKRMENIVGPNNEPAGLVAVVAEAQRPQSTQGRVIAVGSDPFVQEQIDVGDIVSFSYLDGTFVHIDGVRFRSLEFQQIIMVTKEERTV
jgi:co-chaperonin GroES (HSP10)